MRKRIWLCMIIGVSMILMSCSLSDSSNNQTNTGSDMTSDAETDADAVIMKDVIFLNTPMGAVSGVPRDSAWEKVNYESEYPYEYNEAEDTDKLYAFHIQLSNLEKGFDEVKPADFPVQGVEETDAEYQDRIALYGKDKLVEIMKSEGIWVLSECLEKETPVCMIACTMSDLVRVFDSDTSVFHDETNIFSKCDYLITSMSRLDWDEVLQKAGWSKETGRESESWYWENVEEVQKLTGTEYQVTMSVEVE